VDFSSLKLAISQIEKSLDFSRSQMALENPELAMQFRSAAIQAFEYTYELTQKMLKRYLQETEGSAADLDSYTFQEYIRLGYERGLLQADLREWMEFRKKRGTTSHTYDSEKAEDVFTGIPKFLMEAKYLLNELERRQALMNE
jgi:nucleotidyltransferase substrate binding protein (TIGR01987 family)